MTFNFTHSPTSFIINGIVTKIQRCIIYINVFYTSIVIFTSVVVNNIPDIIAQNTYTSHGNNSHMCRQKYSTTYV